MDGEDDEMRSMATKQAATPADCDHARSLTWDRKNAIPAIHPAGNVLTSVFFSFSPATTFSGISSDPLQQHPNFPIPGVDRILLGF
jgi:hypothetical protein